MAMSSCSKRRLEKEDDRYLEVNRDGDQALETIIVGDEDRSAAHEVSRYVWWDSHEGSTIQMDRTFRSQRMALLYCAKLNSESFKTFANESGKDWVAYFVAGAYALQPNRPFDLDSFKALPDEVLKEYVDGVANAFSRHKVPKGVTYRYAPREMKVVEFNELMGLLRREGYAEVQGHVKRQALLLSDIAGFD